MNIFDIYLNKIKNIVTNNSANLKIPQNLSGINVDTAPAKFKADISTNVCMVLSSLNKLPPTEIYKQLNLDDLKNDKDIENIEFVKPGFVNIKFVKKFWNTFLTKMLNDQKYGAILKNDKIIDKITKKLTNFKCSIEINGNLKINVTLTSNSDNNLSNLDKQKQFMPNMLIYNLKDLNSFVNSKNSFENLSIFTYYPYKLFLGVLYE